jgi:hypothetical protein
VLITDEDGRIVSTATFSTPSSRSPAPALVNSDTSSPEISIEQGGIVHEASSDLFLVPGEQVIISASDWSEFHNYCDTCHDLTLYLDGYPYGNSVADILAVEIQQAGKMCGIELRIVARTPSLRTSVEFQARIPGTYPLSSDPPSPPPVISRISSIDIPRTKWSKRGESALGLDGVPPLHKSGGSCLDSSNEDGNQHGTALAFTTPLPTTLRDIVKRAGEMNFVDDVVVP